MNNGPMKHVQKRHARKKGVIFMHHARVSQANDWFNVFILLLCSDEYSELDKLGTIAIF